MVITLPEAAGTTRSTEVTEMPFTPIAMVADAAITFPEQLDHQEPMQVFAQEQSQATTGRYQHKATAPFVAQAMPNVFTTGPAAHATM